MMATILAPPSTTSSGAAIVSDATKFCHHYLPAPTLTLEDKLLHALQAINVTLLHTTQQPASDQLAAINMLQLILSDYKASVAPPGVGPPPGVLPTIGDSVPLPEVPHHWHCHQTRAGQSYHPDNSVCGSTSMHPTSQLQRALGTAHTTNLQP